MSDRIPDNNCEHYNLVPIWFIKADIYIFWCKDCDTFILRDFTQLELEQW